MDKASTLGETQGRETAAAQQNQEQRKKKKLVAVVVVAGGVVVAAILAIYMWPAHVLIESAAESNDPSASVEPPQLTQPLPTTDGQDSASAPPAPAPAATEPGTVMLADDQAGSLSHTPALEPSAHAAQTQSTQALPSDTPAPALLTGVPELELKAMQEEIARLKRENAVLKKRLARAIAARKSSEARPNRYGADVHRIYADGLVLINNRGEKVPAAIGEVTVKYGRLLKTDPEARTFVTDRGVFQPGN